MNKIISGQFGVAATPRTGRTGHTMHDGTVCDICGISAEVMQLEKCPICFKYFCADCAYRATGRRLCSERCAMFMIQGDDDDEIDDDE